MPFETGPKYSFEEVFDDYVSDLKSELSSINGHNPAQSEMLKKAILIAQQNGTIRDADPTIRCFAASEIAGLKYYFNELIAKETGFRPLRLEEQNLAPEPIRLKTLSAIRQQCSNCLRKNGESCHKKRRNINRMDMIAECYEGVR
jgi:hypothetical protein